MTSLLTTGALLSIMRQEKILEPHLQLLKCRKLNSNGDKTRLRLLLSDGKYCFDRAMLATEESIEIFSVIKVKSYHVSRLETTKQYVLLIHEIEVITRGAAVGEQIGDPKALTDDTINNESVSSEDMAATSSNQGKISLEATAKNIIPTCSDNEVPTSSAHRDLPLVASASNTNISPIESLNPYRKKWVIKARVSSKSEMMHFKSSDGEFFNVNFFDSSGEIMCTAFNQLAHEYFNYLQEGKVYFITKCKVIPTEYNFTYNPYEMEITNETSIVECSNDVDSIPLYTKYNFTTLDKVGALDTCSAIDVIGVCKETCEVETVMLRSPRKETKKRKIILMDQSKTCIPVTLWGSRAESFDGTDNPVIAIKRAKIDEFQGCKNLSLSLSSEVKINPQIDECATIKNWYNILGKHVNVEKCFSDLPWMCLKEVKDRGLGYTENGDYFQVFATILNVHSHNAVYKGCPSSDCKKKLVDLGIGAYRCEKCDKIYPNFKYYLRLYMNVADFSDNQWVTVFGEEAEKILGRKAEEVGVIVENGDERAETIFEPVYFKQFIFKCRTNLRNFNDEQKLQTMVLQVNSVDHEKYNSYLADEIKKFMT